MDHRVIDEELFLATMANVAASVTVVTTYTDNDEPRGLTVSAFTSVSLDPPLVLICIGSESSSIDALRSRGGFTVSFLAEGEGPAALQMALSDDDKFAGMALTPPAHPRTGPRLADVAYGYFECLVHAEIEAGDHSVFIGLVVDGEVVDDRLPLVYHRRSFVEIEGS